MMSEDEDDFVSVTRAVEYQLIHTWRIENFEQYFCSKYHLSSIHSHIFSHDEDPATKWSLQVFPKGDKDSNSQNTGGSDMVSFFINLDKSSETVELPAKYSAVILAKESEENGKEKVIPKVNGTNTFKRGSGWGRSKFMKLEELLKDRSVYLPDDGLTLRVKIEYAKHVTEMEKRRKNSVNMGNSVISIKASLSPCTIASSAAETTKAANPNKRPNMEPCHVESTRNAMDWYDVTFSVSGTRIHAHRWIVNSACPALIDLIQQSNDSVVYVEGVEAATFTELIRFVYTGSCDFTNYSYKLLTIGHRFRFPTLQLKCEEYLLTVLNQTNCFMLYSLGDLCCSTHLKTAATRMIESLGFMCNSNNLSNGVTTA